MIFTHEDVVSYKSCPEVAFTVIDLETVNGKPSYILSLANNAAKYSDIQQVSSREFLREFVCKYTVKDEDSRFCRYLIVPIKESFYLHKFKQNAR